MKTERSFVQSQITKTDLKHTIQGLISHTHNKKFEFHIELVPN
jgi:hypothetical protein